MSWAEFSLLAVTLSFAALVVWVYWPSRRRRLESYGAMPLDETLEPGARDPGDGRGGRS